MTCLVDFKGLTRITASDKILREEAFNIAKKPKYDGYQRIASIVSKFLDKKLLVLVLNQNMSDQQLTEELRKPIIR